MDIQAEMKQKAEAAKRAAARLALLSTDVKNKALLAMADALEKRSEVILQANELDLEDARQKKVKRSYLDRLLLDEGRIASMAEGLRQTAALPDPVATGDYSTVPARQGSLQGGHPGGRHPVRRLHGPRGRRCNDAHARLSRRHHPARRRRPHQTCHGEFICAGH